MCVLLSVVYDLTGIAYIHPLRPTLVQMSSGLPGASWDHCYGVVQCGIGLVWYVAHSRAEVAGLPLHRCGHWGPELSHKWPCAAWTMQRPARRCGPNPAKPYIAMLIQDLCHLDNTKIGGGSKGLQANLYNNHTLNQVDLCRLGNANTGGAWQGGASCTLKIPV